jgi:hypothetical protein
MIINNALAMLDIGEDGDPFDNEIIKSLVGARTGRAAREKKFYSILHDNIVKKYEDDKPARDSKEKKLTALRDHLYTNGWTKRTFDVIDRKRENNYLVTTVDLWTGRGFQLGHKVAGAEFTDKNTFLQFPNDNIFNSAHDITEGYWIEYGSWVADMMEQNPDTDIDAFEDTLKFCEIMEDRLI